MKKRAMFIDTVYILGLLNPRDRLHGKAAEMSGTVRGPFVTSDAILTEVGDALSQRSRRAWSAEAIADLRADPDVTCVCIDAATFAAGLELYRNMADKDWSLTDCFSFVIMRREQITDALTADVHFVQAGFRALMRE
jgi:predicted nucleic acid-binding protein